MKTNFTKINKTQVYEKIPNKIHEIAFFQQEYEIYKIIANSFKENINELKSLLLLALGMELNKNQSLRAETKTKVVDFIYNL